MPTLPRYTLSLTALDDWQLTSDDTGEVVSRFPTKKDAVRSGVLKKTLGSRGGFVQIRGTDGGLAGARVCPPANGERRFER